MKKLLSTLFLYGIVMLFNQGIYSQAFEATNLPGNVTFQVNCNGNICVSDPDGDIQAYSVVLTLQGNNVIPIVNLDATDIALLGGQIFNPPTFPGVAGQDLEITITIGGVAYSYNVGDILDTTDNCECNTEVINGTSFTLCCDGSILVEPDCDVMIYKAWVGGVNIVEFNNYRVDELNVPLVITNPGCTEITGQDAGGKFWIDVQYLDPNDNFIYEVSSELDDLDCTDSLTGPDDGSEDRDKGGEGDTGGKRNKSSKDGASLLNKETVIYPNPAHDEINIDLPVTETDYEILIIDMSGMLIEKIINKGGNIVIPASQLTAGSYLVKIKNGKLNVTDNIQIIR